MSAFLLSLSARKKLASRVLSGKFAFLVVIGLGTYFWWPALWHGKIMLHTDSATLFMPMLSLLSEALNDGDSLLWVNQIYGGHPLFAEGQAGATSPLNIAAAYLLDPIYGLGVLHYIYMLIGGAGVYTLCSILGVTRWSSVFSSVAVIFSGAWLHNSHNLAIVSTLAWAPWLMVAVELWFKSPNIYRGGLLAIPAVLMVFSGYPSVTHGVVVYVLVSLLTCFISRADRKSLAAGWKSYLVTGIFAVLIAVGLSAVQLLPLMELVHESHRANGVALPFAGLTPLSDYLKGLLYLHPQDGVARITMSLSSVVCTTLLVLLIFFKYNSRISGHALAGFMLFNMGIEFASPIFRFVYDHNIVPGLHNYRIVHPFLAVAVIGLAVAAGYSLDGLRGTPGQGLNHLFARNRKLLVASGGVIFALMSLCAIFTYAAGLSLAALICAFFLLGTGVVLTCFNRLNWMPVAAVIVLSVEVLMVRAHPFNFFSTEVVQRPPVVEKILAEPDYLDYHTRMAAHGIEMVFMSGANPDLEASYTRFARTLPPFIGLRWGIPSVDGGLALPLRRRMLIDEILSRELAKEFSESGRTRLLDVLGIRYLSLDTPVAAAGFKLFYKDTEQGIFYFKNLRAQPRFQVYGQAVVVADVDAVVDRVHSAPQGCLLVESAATLTNVDFKSSCAEARPVASKIDVLEASSTHYSFNVESDKDAWFFMADANYPGWVATVNGVSQHIYSAQILGKAVKIEAGNNRVEMAYLPRLFYIGLAVTVLTGLALAFCALYGLFKRLSVRTFRSLGADC